MRIECGGRKDTDGINWVGKSELVVLINKAAYCRFGGTLGQTLAAASDHLTPQRCNYFVRKRTERKMKLENSLKKQEVKTEGKRGR